MLLVLLSAVALPVAIFLALVVAPVEAVQGEPYRILYVHVPSVVAAYAAFTVTCAASILYLWKRAPRWDRLAAASAEVGLVFLTLVLLTGPIWGRAVWGAWWTWDARLTTALILWFIFAAYMMLRAYLGPQGAAASAIVAVIGFLDIPLIHWSALLLRTLHPRPAVFRSDPSLPPSMLAVLAVNIAAFILIYLVLLSVRLRQETALARLREEEDPA